MKLDLTVCLDMCMSMWETWVQSLGWEDPQEKEAATHSSILPWEKPMDRGTWRATVHGVAESQTKLTTRYKQ